MVPETVKASFRTQAECRQQKARGLLTEAGLQILRETAKRNQPWRRSTGPRTEEGKRRSAANGWLHCRSPNSQRQVRDGLAEIYRLLIGMGAVRRAVSTRDV